jgi:hypothetical protein
MPCQLRVSLLSSLLLVRSWNGEDVQLINVWVEDTIYEADRGRFIGILVWNLDVDFPVATGEGCCLGRISADDCFARRAIRTLFWTLESHVEFLPAACVSERENSEEVYTDTVSG